jgi:PKD repeat protein
MAAEEIPPSKGGKISGWLKAGVTTLIGLISGALVAHLSPLLDKAVAPPKPLANFQYTATGLKVVFQNLSTDAQSGWWDFGDGTALEPFAPNQPTVTHSYAKPGNYTVKLALHNFVNDENERSVTVMVDNATSAPPSIATFEVLPVRLDCYAPATFRLVTDVKNADQCVWALGNQPLELSRETANGKRERFVTFKDPGQYVIRLAAYNGEQPVELYKTVEVKKPPLGTIMASLTVTYDAVLIENKTSSTIAQVRFPTDNKTNSCTFDGDCFRADDGFEIKQATFLQPVKEAFVKKADLQISADKRKVRLAGELVKAQSNAPAPVWIVQVQIIQEKRGAPIKKVMDPVAVNLTVPGSTLLPLPPLPQGWTARNRTLTLTQDGKQMAWKEGQLPRNAGVQMSSSTYIVNATEQDNQLRVDLSDVWNAWSMFGN